MSMFPIIFFMFAAAAFLVTLLITLAKLYKRATKEISYVRTGFGGEKVIVNGGALVFPILHDTIPVNMNTLRLAVSRRDDQALITRDRMRVDVVAEFYVRTQPTAESIANAAQTLGERTMHPQTLKELVEGKFVDALRSVAAEMTMEELHEKRTDFVTKVQHAVSEDLLKNGLELETVSLTSLDQTHKSFFNPDNAFDAEGLTRLTEEIERRKKVRNDIEQDTNVQIAAKIMESEKKRLEIARDEEYARLAQEREVSVRKAIQESEIAKAQAEQKKLAEEANITAYKDVEQFKIAADRYIAIEQIEKEQHIKEKEIEKAVAIHNKSKLQSESKTVAELARALSVEAEEKVISSREKEAAERNKLIELIEAEKQAQKESIALKVAAKAEKEAASDQAEAIRALAQAHADKERIEADAKERTFIVEAKGRKDLNEAANTLSPEQVNLKVKIKIIEKLENIIRESVKPLESIDGIKIIQVGGLPGRFSDETIDETRGNPKNLGDQVVNSALKYRAQAPILDSLLREVGLKGDDIQGFTSSLTKDINPLKD